MKEAVLLAVGLVRGLLDAAANHLWTRAPDEGILRTDLHQGGSGDGGRYPVQTLGRAWLPSGQRAAHFCPDYHRGSVGHSTTRDQPTFHANTKCCLVPWLMDAPLCWPSGDRVETSGFTMESRMEYAKHAKSCTTKKASEPWQMTQGQR